MLAGDRSSVAGHKIGGFFHEGTPLANSELTHEIEIDPAMNAALSEMSVERGPIFIFLVEPAQITEIASDFFRRHCRVLPSFPGQWFAWDECRGPESSLTNVPYFLLFGLVDKQLHRWCARSIESRHSGSRLLLRFFDCACTKLHYKPSLPLRKDGQVIDLGHAFLFHVVDQKVVDALKTDGLVFKNFRNVITRFVNAWIAKNQEDSLGIAVDEPDLRLQNCDACALAPYEGSRNVKASVVAGQQMVKAIS